MLFRSGTLTEAMNVVAARYINEVEPRALFEGAMEGMVRQLDPYSVYTAPDKFEQFQQQLEGELTGIGIIVDADATSERLIRRVALPGWSVARNACDPDLVLDESGSAIISSNVQARLWRIDGGTLTVSERDITLQERENWDVGFTALAPADNGKLLAVTSLAGSFWSIDLDKGIALMAAPSAALQNLCGLTAQQGNRP